MSNAALEYRISPPGPDHRMAAIITLLAGVCAGVVFILWPWIDIHVAGLFLQADGRYLLKGTDLGRALRTIFKAIFVLGAGITVVAFILSLYQRRSMWGQSAMKWLYLIFCLAIGPGLLANVILKDHWGRARPIHVSHQGKQFTPALIPSDQCERNCSFVSGESSSIYALFFAAAFLGGRWWRRYLGLGLFLGSAAGIMRMAQGGHYLSDVIFSGVFMALVALALHAAFFNRRCFERGERPR